MIGRATTASCNKIRATVYIEGAPCKMEVDIRSALFLVSWSTIKLLVPRIAKRQLDARNIHI